MGLLPPIITNQNNNRRDKCIVVYTYGRTGISRYPNPTPFSLSNEHLKDDPSSVILPLMCIVEVIKGRKGVVVV